VRSRSKDTRLLVAGIVAFLALVVYLGVAFANTHASNGLTVSAASKVAPWTPWGSILVPIPRGKHGGYAVRVVAVKPEATKLGSYGGLVPTLVPQPTPGTRFVIGLGLRATRPGPVGIQIHEFRSGTPSRYLVQTTVPVTRKWRRFRFSGQVRGSWVGLSLYAYRLANAARKPSFVIRGLTVNLR